MRRSRTRHALPPKHTDRTDCHTLRHSRAWLRATGYGLDSNSSGSVYGLAPNGGNYQKWYVNYSEYGTVTLMDGATWRCLDSNTSGSVYTLPCNGGSFQKWVVLGRNYGTVVLRDLATGF